MENRKSEMQGITLIALVITIIIILILASIGTYSGISVIKSSKFTRFGTGLKIMQAKVNEWYDEYRNGNEEIIQKGEDIADKEKVEKAFNGAGIKSEEEKADYRFFSESAIKALNIEEVDGDFLINIKTRSVISYEGFEYQGKIYYTVEQIPNNLYNVRYQESDEPEKPEDLEEGKSTLTNGGSTVAQQISASVFDKCTLQKS